MPGADAAVQLGGDDKFGRSPVLEEDFEARPREARCAEQVRAEGLLHPDV